MLVLGLIGEWIPAFAGMTNTGFIMTFYGTITINPKIKFYQSQQAMR
jgi:hypothetical protein